MTTEGSKADEPVVSDLWTVEQMPASIRSSSLR